MPDQSARQGHGLRSRVLAALFTALAAEIGCGRQPFRPEIERSPPTAATRASTGTTVLSATGTFTDLMTSNDLRVIATTGDGQQRYTILESLGCGVGLLDYDQDGLVDIFAVGGGSFDDAGQPVGLPATLLHNEGDSRFSDATRAAGIVPPGFYSHGVCVFDLEGDGFPDLLVTGFHGCLLYRNLRNGSFEIVPPATLGITSDLWFTSAAAADFNADGCIDLYLTSYVDWSPENDPPCRINEVRDICPPAQFNGLPDRLYLGCRDSESGPLFRLADEAFQPTLAGKGLGVVAADFDLDGDTDIYVANDTTPNAVYENQENRGLREVGLLSGCSLGLSGVPDGSMGVDVGDFDGDGMPDLWVSNFERESFGLYRNAGSMLFQNVSLPMGIGRLDRTFVGFGTGFVDVDGDGFEDLFSANGHVLFHPRNAPRRQEPLLLRNDQGAGFTAIGRSVGGYLAEPHTGRGLAIGDLDNDGDQDLVVSHADEPLAVLRNDRRPNAVLRLRLVGTAAHRDAVGASALLETSSRKLLRLVKGGGSYLSASDHQLVFSLAEDEVPEAVEILWPGGRRSRHELSRSHGSGVVTEGRLEIDWIE